MGLSARQSRSRRGVDAKWSQERLQTLDTHLGDPPILGVFPKRSRSTPKTFLHITDFQFLIKVVFCLNCPKAFPNILKTFLKNFLETNQSSMLDLVRLQSTSYPEQTYVLIL